MHLQVDCAPKYGQKDVLAVFVDNEEVRNIHTSIFGKKPDFSTHFLALAEFIDHLAELEYAGAKKYALRALSLRSLHSSELHKNLKDRLVSEQTIQKILEELQQLGYLDDREWIDGFIRRSVRQKFGPKAIEKKLRAKGIRLDQAADALSRYQNSGLEGENIRKLLKTRYVRRDLSNYHERQKVIASLVRKGFEVSEILSVLGEL